MRHLRLLPLVLLLVPAFALAQIDPGPNGVGIYFDQQATQTVKTTGPNTGVQAWVVATNLPAGHSVIAWTGSIVASNGAVDAPPASCPGMWVWGGATFGSNYEMNQCCDRDFGYDVFSGSANALPVGAATVLGSVTVTLGGCEEPIYLYLSPSVLHLVGVAEEIALNPSSGAWSRPLAVINGPAPVATEPETWGHLKGLYR